MKIELTNAIKDIENKIREVSSRIQNIKSLKIDIQR